MTTDAPTDPVPDHASDHASDPVLALADEQYVLLTTTRRNGVPVPTPVWVVRHGDALLVTTGAEAGKVKRIRHTPRVTLQACDRVGRPLEGAPVVEAVATVHDDAQSRADIVAALTAKYGVQYRMIRAMGALRGSRDGGSTVVRLVAPQD